MCCSATSSEARRVAALLGALAFVSSVAGAASAAPPAPVGGDPVRVERRVGLMGTDVRVEVEATSREAALAASETVIRTLASAEARLSTWRPDTELARLNAARGPGPVPVSAELSADLEGALACAQRTGGAFDPTVAPLVRAWGLRGRPRVPAPEALAGARARVGHAGLRVEKGRAWRPEGVAVEEGGFGKGAALDHVRAALAGTAAQAALVDLGGQVLLAGRPWTVRVAHPGHRQRPAVELTLEGGSLATTGNGERGLATQTGRVGHVLDPRTGRPAADFGSVTVWAPSALDADCLSTGLFVEGPDAALAFAAASADVEVLVLEPLGAGLRIRASAGLVDRVRVLWPDARLELATEREVP